jgi:hypothetical protein
MREGPNKRVRTLQSCSYAFEGTEGAIEDGGAKEDEREAVGGAEEPEGRAPGAKALILVLAEESRGEQAVR